MLLTLTMLGCLSLLEILLWWAPLWKMRRVSVPALQSGLAITSGVLIGQRLSLWTLLLTILTGYRLINLLRIYENNVQEDYLYRASRRTSWWLLAGQSAILLAAAIFARTGTSVLSLVYLVCNLLLLASLVLLYSTLRNLKTTLPGPGLTALADRDLPTLTVGIPARNETTDLEDCLRSLIASDYPKLEILVLDDCSQEKRTPEIIRGFAHDGVRFLAGTPPPEGWSAKNHAYNQLAAEANGQLLLFCGVDVRFEVHTLSAIVKTMLHKKKSMISWLPANVLPMPRRLLSLCIQPGRYVWELTLPRRLLQRPPVLSTCWIIKREVLEAAGGFAAVRRKIIPESYFAKINSRLEDGYSFLQADAHTGLSCVKTLDEQQATTIRTRYPQLHRRPEMVALIALAEITLLIWPLVVLVAALLTQTWLLLLVAVLLCGLNFYTYSMVVNLTYRRFYWPGLFVLPIAAMYDVGLLHYSMWQYEFGEVIWKGRNVRFPVMHAIPQLPPQP